MDEYVLINGRPYGGVAILWNRCMTYRVAPVEYSSTRICAVIVYLDNDEFFLLICVYMPCDDRRRGHNLNEFIDILNDISIICNYADVNYVCIAGDLNTDLNTVGQDTKPMNYRDMWMNRVGCFVLMIHVARWILRSVVRALVLDPSLIILY